MPSSILKRISTKLMDALTIVLVKRKQIDGNAKNASIR